MLPTLPRHTDAGGYMEFLCSPFPGGQPFPIAFFIAQFNYDSGSNYPYQSRNCLGPPGSTTLGETTVVETAENIAGMWAPYYTPDATLYWTDLWTIQNGRLDESQEAFYWEKVYHGSATAAATSGPRSSRTFLFAPRARFVLPSRAAHQHTLFLNGVPEPNRGRSGVVTPTEGGIDERDRDVVRYVTGFHTGICSVDCTRFARRAQLREWLAMTL